MAQREAWLFANSSIGFILSVCVGNSTLSHALAHLSYFYDVFYLDSVSVFLSHPPDDTSHESAEPSRSDANRAGQLRIAIPLLATATCYAAVLWLL